MLEAIEEITVPTVSDVYEEDDGNAPLGVILGVIYGSAIWGVIFVVWLVLR